MRQHPYLRAYMAGITAPTMLLLIALTVFCVVRFVYHVPVPIERVIVFPMAIVPNLFGVWNMFYHWLHPRRHLPIGFHGALLPFILAPVGLTIGHVLDLVVLEHRGVVYFNTVTVPYGVIAVAFSGGVVVYYLIWKHLVSFFNEVLGIA